MSSVRDAAAPLGRLSPYFAEILARAEALALRIHADELVVEHLVGAAIVDEDSAANEVIAHAFADPETLAGEILALCPGLLVVGSGATMPFSPAAAASLRHTRAAAAAAGLEEIGPGEVLSGALVNLPEGARAALEEAGCGAPAPAAGDSESPVPAEGPLFKRFTTPAKQVLSRACRRAKREELDAIGPVHLALACLEVEPGLERALGFGIARLGALLTPFRRDETAPEARSVPPDGDLVTFLDRLPDGAGSLELLAACHGDGHPELRELLLRHKITLPLLERCRGHFEDPA